MGNEKYPTGVENHGGKLRISFVYKGKRVRENLGVPDTAKNRKVASELRITVLFEIKMVTSVHYATNSLSATWETAVKRSGIRRRNAYQSRHTYACWSLAVGANPNFIANQIGHVNVQMVYNVYGAWMADNNQSQVNILNQALSSFAPRAPQASLVA